jgi:hypothetical protein
MPPRERQVILIGKDGKVLFHGARCLITETDDGNYQIIDLSRDVAGAQYAYEVTTNTDITWTPPTWLRRFIETSTTPEQAAHIVNQLANRVPQ